MSTHPCDFITYAGPINMIGYQALCAALEKKAANKAVLVLATPGGDPHAGFRIARALQHSYEKFDALGSMPFRVEEAALIWPRPERRDEVANA